MPNLIKKKKDVLRLLHSWKGETIDLLMKSKLVAKETAKDQVLSRVFRLLDIGWLETTNNMDEDVKLAVAVGGLELTEKSRH